MSHRIFPTRRSVADQKGMTLIEVLVTLILVSVGLLGVAALQLASLRNNEESYMRSQASVLAADILDRMRANSIAFRAGDYDVSFSTPEEETAEEAPAEETEESEGEEEATDSAASRDIAAWQTELARLLPNGTGQIESDGNIATITIRWSERPAEDAEGGEDLRQPTLQTRSEI
jgi:type IV pilus assembly protein PilV